MARMGRGRWQRGGAYARGAEPMERGQGSLMGAVAHRARLRSQVRPSAGRAFPSRDRIPEVAAGQKAARLPLRPARSNDRLRSEEGFRRGRAKGISQDMMGIAALNPSYGLSIHLA